MTREGSGKTLTSFKAAELIEQLGYCDKVIFLMDRVTLATQTVLEFEGFSNYEEINSTKNTNVLINKLLSDIDNETLIVTSIQKMSNVVEDRINDKRLNKIKNKRIVFIIDEAHRSTFGKMLTEIKGTYKDALFFGFTGTPIGVGDKEYDNTTVDIFGDELHRYSIADGIRDKNVLPFDVSKTATIKDKELRQAVALSKAGVDSVDEFQGNDKAYAIYKNYMDSSKYPMIKIEDLAGNDIYKEKEHKQKVVDDILDSWPALNHNNEFSALFATSSIKEAIEYWRLLKDNERGLKVTCLFDSSDGTFNEFSIEKEDGLKDIIKHYNKMFNQSFTIPTHDGFKADIALRLAQKDQYRNIDADKKIDIVIVVYQLLTGYDSKWVNMLFLDKVLEGHNLIQAFSRTNRLNGSKKPHGTIKYYRKVNTMEKNIEEAVREYSGNKPLALFVDKLPQNIREMNLTFDIIRTIFENEKIENFSKLPESGEAIAMFVKQFNYFDEKLKSALTQGFRWEKESYVDDEYAEVVKVTFTEKEYNTLVQRYKEVKKEPFEGSGTGGNLIFDLNYDIIETTSKIDYDYINSNFEKYLKVLFDKDVDIKDIEKLKNSLHKNFSSLPRDRQILADMIINDLESGDLKIEEGWDFNDYINAYSVAELDKQIQSIVDFTGIDGVKLKSLLNLKLNNKNINEYGRFDNLKKTINHELLADNLFDITNKKFNALSRNIYIDNMLRKFLMEETFDMEVYNKVNLENEE